MIKYTTVICGATFDQFHKGHKEFLQFALRSGKKVFLGLTSDSYIANHKKIEGVEPFETRKYQVISYLKAQKVLDRVVIMPIESAGIPSTLEKVAIDAIVVTADSLQGAKKINAEREMKGQRALSIVEFPLVLAEDGMPISATRIRNGEISDEGVVFFDKKWLLYTLFLPQHLRKKLQKPFGEIIDIKTVDTACINWEKTVSVGDVTTSLLNKQNKKPLLSIVDFIVERKKTYNTLSELGFLGNEQKVEIKNPPGQITPDLWKTLRSFFGKSKPDKTVIKIDGEEDLGVLPVILLAPLGWHILYGQPGVGTVHLETNLASKQHAHELLKGFTIRQLTMGQ